MENSYTDKKEMVINEYKWVPKIKQNHNLDIQVFLQCMKLFLAA